MLKKFLAMINHFLVSRHQVDHYLIIIIIIKVSFKIMILKRMRNKVYSLIIRLVLSFRNLLKIYFQVIKNQLKLSLKKIKMNKTMKLIKKKKQNLLENLKLLN